MTKKQVSLLLFAVFLASLDLSLIGPALNTVGALWGVSERTLSWGVSIYSLLSLIGIPLLARTSDLLGRRVVLIAGMAIFVVGSLIVAQAQSFDGLLVGRAVQGFGAGGITPVVVALVGDAMPRERQASALGMIGAMLGLGFIVGPVLGGILLHLTWRLLFLINLPLGVFVIVAMIRWLPAGRPAGKIAMDWPGLALLTASFGLLALGINRLDIRNLAASFASPTVWPLFAANLVLLPVFYANERRASHPIIRPSLLRARRIVVTNVMSLGAGLGLISIQFIPRMAKLAFGVHDASASLMLVPAALTFVVASFVVGALLKKLGPLRVLVVFGLLFAAGMAVFATQLDRLWAFYVGTIVLSFGLAGITGPSLRYIINLETTAQDRGAAQALLLNVQLIGQLTGAALIGAFAASWGGALRGYSIIFLVLAGEALVMTGLTAALRRSTTAAATVPAAASTR
jgi:MFS family permease